mmetsp:Transcript_92176/g.284875  ORF Transcript_92176/g.284875 Transcript_92176/m.284875 type:complete len:327 (+) Transcript_92176:2-982(+)
MVAPPAPSLALECRLRAAASQMWRIRTAQVQRWVRKAPHDAAGSRVACGAFGALAVGAACGVNAKKLRLLSCASSSASKELTVEEVRTSKKAQAWVELNANKSETCLVNTDTQEWIETAAKGVYRKLIERLGGEVARATSVVRFDAGMSFPAHMHGGGEEFLVLEGAWHDEWATQPKYTYVRNYIGSTHQPSIGMAGCTIMVKLRQMAHEHKEPEHTQWDVSPNNPNWKPSESIRGCRVLQVYLSPYEEVHFELWEAGATGVVEVQPRGSELFVMEGSFTDELGEHRTWSWTREASAGEQRHRTAGPAGCLMYVKSGHLESPEVGG